jgi:hypothetical protein
MVVRASQNPSNYQKKSGNLSENPENRKKSLREERSRDYSQLSEEVCDNEY